MYDSPQHDMVSPSLQLSMYLFFADHVQQGYDIRNCIRLLSNHIDQFLTIVKMKKYMLHTALLPTWRSSSRNATTETSDSSSTSLSTTHHTSIHGSKSRNHPKTIQSETGTSGGPPSTTKMALECRPTTGEAYSPEVPVPPPSHHPQEPHPTNKHQGNGTSKHKNTSSTSSPKNNQI